MEFLIKTEYPNKGNIFPYTENRAKRDDMKLVGLDGASLEQLKHLASFWFDVAVEGKTWSKKTLIKKITGESDGDSVTVDN